MDQVKPFITVFGRGNNRSITMDNDIKVISIDVTEQPDYTVIDGIVQVQVSVEELENDLEREFVHPDNDRKPIGLLAGSHSHKSICIVYPNKKEHVIDETIRKLNESNNDGIKEFIFKPSYVELDDYALNNHWKKPSIFPKTINVQKTLKKPLRIRLKRVNKK